MTSVSSRPTKRALVGLSSSHRSPHALGPATPVFCLSHKHTNHTRGPACFCFAFWFAYPSCLECSPLLWSPLKSHFLQAVLPEELLQCHYLCKCTTSHYLPHTFMRCLQLDPLPSPHGPSPLHCKIHWSQNSESPAHTAGLHRQLMTKTVEVTHRMAPLKMDWKQHCSSHFQGPGGPCSTLASLSALPPTPSCKLRPRGAWEKPLLSLQA